MYLDFSSLVIIMDPLKQPKIQNQVVISYIFKYSTKRVKYARTDEAAFKIILLNMIVLYALHSS